MKIAIHHRPDSFSDRWIEYCKINNIDYRLVNCFDSDIIQQMDDCDALMWHWAWWDSKVIHFARQLTLSLEHMGKKVYPDSKTSWHYDDKLGQKYLLEAVNAPLVKTHIFYSKKEALQWAKLTSFPKVFKLRTGAASANVKLVKDYKKAKRLIHKAFSNGFKKFNRSAYLKDKINLFLENKTSANFWSIIVQIVRVFIPNKNERISNREKGYIYFQDFIPDNTYDTRITIIGNRCLSSRRYTRKNDFRASGSFLFDYNPKFHDNEVLKIGLNISRALNLQSVVMDFVIDNGQYKLVEVSYCMPSKVMDEYPGYYNEKLEWQDNNVNIEYFIIEDFIKSLKQS
jgi:glutathione synthase/RimK-type ligase-like ATP-grasp enzyme